MMQGSKHHLTPSKTPRKIKVAKVTPGKRVSVRVNPHAPALRCLENFEYKKGLQKLFNNSKAARKAMLDILNKTINDEMKSVEKANSFLSRPCTYENIKKFNWNTIMSEISSSAPTFMSILSNTFKLDSKLPYGRSSKACLGFVASLILHVRMPHCIKFLQAMIGVELWRCGAKRKLFKHLNALGACCSIQTTLRHMSNLKVGADSKVVKMKSDLETQLPLLDELNVQQTAALDSESDAEIDSTEGLIAQETESESSEPELDDMDGVEAFPDSDKDESVTESDVLCPGYTLVWDNVGKMVRTRHMSSNRQNKMMLWALAYCATNRIPTTHLVSTETKLATEIPINRFLMQPGDIRSIQDRMVVIIGKILVNDVPFFSSNYPDSAVKHVKHEHWEQSSQKSEVTNLGVLHENPSTITGTINILEQLHEYVPEVDGDVYPMICFGDGLSCERHNDAHKARVNGATRRHRLLGLQPVVQEFHKRMLLMQDLMDTFYSGSSGTEKGTLFHLKNVFGHRNVKKDVGDCFSSVADLVQFATRCYVVLAALHILQMSSLDDEPDIQRLTTATSKRQQLHDVASSVMDLIWPSLTDLEESTDYEFCICKEDLGDDQSMIECHNSTCPNGSHFHLECLGMDEDDVPDGDWYCSLECQATPYQYCVCHTDLGNKAPMVACENLSCPRGEWFHLQCVGITETDIPDWYCSSWCEENRGKGPEPDDHVNQYVKGLTYWGLMDMVRRDAVRENDGTDMLAHWRHDMFLFHNRNHCKYVILGHRLLAAHEGWLPERLREDAVWNRTVNLSGGPGKNLEMDLVNEFLNKEFKESLKGASGVYTEETISRHSQVAGALGKDLDRIFEEQVAELETKELIKYEKLRDISVDLRTFLSLMTSEGVWENVPGREFRSFKGFLFAYRAKNLQRLKDKLQQLSKRLDKLKRVLNF